MIQIGDWVTQYSAGYWQVVDIRDKYAEEDSVTGEHLWKKGEKIGKWIFLKKAFTPKMKLRIWSECVDEYCFDILPRLKPWDSLTSSGSIIQSYRLNYSHCVQDLC